MLIKMLAEKLIYFYILLLPLMHLPKPNFMGNKLQYADLIFIPLFLIFVFRFFKIKFKLIKDRISLFLILLIVISLLSLLHTPYKKELFLDTLGIIYLISLYFVFSGFINNEETFSRVAFFISLATFFTAIIGLFIFIFYNLLNFKIFSNYLYLKTSSAQSSFVPFSRTASFMTSPEMFINFLLFGLSGIFIFKSHFSRKTDARRRRRKILNFFIIIVVISAFLAFSRSLVGLTLFLALVAFYFKKRNPLSYTLRIFCLLLFILFFLSAIILWVFTIYPISFSVDKSTRIVNLTFNSGLDTRIYLTKAALNIGNKHPFLGLGLGSFTDHFKEFLSGQDADALAKIRQTSPSLLRIDPHSLYFGTIAELGYSGFVILLLFFFSVLFKLRMAYKLAGENYWLKDSSYIIFCALCGYLLDGYFVDILSLRSFWIVLALGIVVSELVKKSKEIIK